VADGGVAVVQVHAFRLRISGDDSIAIGLHCFDICGEFRDQADAKWIVIRGPLGGHNDTPYRQPTPGWPFSRLGVGRP
jgi:hypothetical protein